MKRKLTLNEELNRLKGLMSYENGQYKNPIISEQKSPVTTPLSQTPKFHGGIGKTGGDKKKKVTSDDITNAGTDIIAPDIIKLLSDKDTTISEADAIKISDGFVTKAERGGSYRKVFKEGIRSGTLHVTAINNFGGVKFKLNSSHNAAPPKKNIRIVSFGDDVNVPKLTIYGEELSNKKEFSNQTELSNYVIDLNIDLFNGDSGEQYFLYPARKKGGEISTGGVNKSGTSFIMVKRPALISGKEYINIVAPSTKKGGGTEGETKEGDPTKVKVDLTIDLSEAFPTEVATLNESEVQELFKDKIMSELQKKGITNFKSEQIRVVSSSSNSWNEKWVAPTHSKSGQLLAGTTDSIGKQVPNNNYDFNQHPPSGTDDTAKNNNLAWQRGQNLLSAIDSVETEYYSSKEATPSVSWRVTDTGGKVDKVGHEGSGQFAIIYISGMGIKVEPGEKKTTPGKNVGSFSQFPIVISSNDGSGGRLITWFGAHQAKILGPGGKFKSKRRTPGTFSGLPKWLNNIIYSGVK